MPMCKHYGNMRSNSTSLLSPHVVLLEDIQLILSLTAAPQIRPPVFNKILSLPSQMQRVLLCSTRTSYTSSSGCHGSMTLDIAILSQLIQSLNTLPLCCMYTKTYVHTFPLNSPSQTRKDYDFLHPNAKLRKVFSSSLCSTVHTTIIAMARQDSMFPRSGNSEDVQNQITMQPQLLPALKSAWPARARRAGMDALITPSLIFPWKNKLQTNGTDGTAPFVDVYLQSLLASSAVFRHTFLLVCASSEKF